MSSLPPFASVLKGRDVEDPVNLWFNRPLAYAIVVLLYRTSITPNQVTLASLLVGLVTTGLWLVGDARAMFWGGVLLWFSAILDGADGILARAKRMTSDLGRALDGSADLVVAAATLLAGFVHLWNKHHDPVQLWVAPLAVGSSILHVYLYDFYKESYLRMQRDDWDGVAEQVAEVEARLARLKLEKAPWTNIVAAQLYRDLIRAQTRVIDLLDPAARREQLRFTVNARVAEIHQRHNRGPMGLWALVSLAPHTYLIAICAMVDRLDIYLWLRVFGANGLFLIALAWQRIASQRTLRDLEAIGAAPVALAL